jgi:Undecaprenyl-phosphate galactose phosphotransferase WbaP
MSVLMTATKNQPLLSDESRSKQELSTLYRCRRFVCALVLVLTDLSTIAVSLSLAIFLRNHLMPRVSSNFHLGAFPFRHYLVFGWLWLLPLIFLGVEGLYTQRRSLWTEIGYLTKAIGLSLAAILAAVALTQQVVSRPTVLLTGANLVVLLPAVRFWTKRFLGMAGLWHKRILILGATATAKLAMRGLSSDCVLGYQVVGVLDDDAAKIGKSVGMYKGQPILVLGGLSEIREQMERTQAKDVLIAMPGLAEEKLLPLVHELQAYCGNVYVVPKLWGLPMMNLQVDGFLRERVMMLKLTNNLAKPWNTWLKRGADLLLGAALTVLALPLFLILTVLIKVDSEGPALFVQERLGYRGRNFRCLKFRTMHVNSGKKLVEYFKGHPQAAEEWRKYAKLRDHDPRVTRLGRFLRKWSFDELPQLLNVLRGEMSLVGPRPYLPEERERIGVELPTILSARPGITGFWQVSGRNQLTFDNRVQVEAWYVRNWTVWLDCIVLVKTFRTVLFPEDGSGTGEDAVLGPGSVLSTTPKVLRPALGINQCEAVYESDTH